MPLQPHAWQPRVLCQGAALPFMAASAQALLAMLQDDCECAHLVGNLCIALQEEDRQEQRHKGQE